MKNVFVSYRRTDSSDVTGRIFDHLTERFGSDRLFKDVESIAPGEDFRAAIANAVGECDVLLAIIGNNWLRATDATGRRRIDNPDDYVHNELKAALERRIPVIPVLVDGIAMPTADDFPEGIREIAFRNAVPVRSDPDFKGDIERLCKQLTKHVPSASKRHFSRHPVFIGAISLCLLFAFFLAMQNFRPSGQKLPASPPAARLLIGMKQWIGYTPLAIASKMKLFPESIQVEFVDVDTVGQMNLALANDEINVAMGLVETHVRECERFINKESDANRPVAFLKLDTSRGADGVVAHKDITSVKDLGMIGDEERRFLFQKHDVSHFLLNHLCQSAGVTFRELKEFGDDASPEAAAELFTEDSKQPSQRYFAVGTYDPYLTWILEPGNEKYYVENARLLIDSDDVRVEGRVVDIMITKKEFLDGNQAAIDALLVGWFRAIELLTNPSQADHPKAVDYARRFNGVPADGANWSSKTWLENSPCTEKEYGEMIDGLRGRRRTEEDKLPAWPNRKENISFFKRPGGHPSQYDKVFNVCKELREGKNLEELDPSDFDGSAVVFDFVD